MGHYGYVRVIFLFNLSLPFPFPLCTSVQHTLPLSFCSRLWVGLKSIFLILLLPHSLSSLPQSLCFLYQHRTPLFCTHPSLFPLLSAYMCLCLSVGIRSALRGGWSVGLRLRCHMFATMTPWRTSSKAVPGHRKELKVSFLFSFFLTLKNKGECKSQCYSNFSSA